MVQYSIQNLSGYLIYHKLGTCTLGYIHPTSHTPSTISAATYYLLWAVHVPANHWLVPRGRKQPIRTHKTKKLCVQRSVGLPVACPPLLSFIHMAGYNAVIVTAQLMTLLPTCCILKKSPDIPYPGVLLNTFFSMVQNLLIWFITFAYYLQHPKCKCILVHVYLKMADWHVCLSNDWRVDKQIYMDWPRMQWFCRMMLWQWCCPAAENHSCWHSAREHATQ